MDQVLLNFFLYLLRLVLTLGMPFPIGTLDLVWVVILTLLLFNCVVLSELLSLYRPVSYLQNWDNDGTY